MGTHVRRRRGRKVAGVYIPPAYSHTRFPNSVFDTFEYDWITTHDLAALLAVWSFTYANFTGSERDGRCWASIGTLAARARMGVTKMKECLARLERHDLITRKRRYNASSVITPIRGPARFAATRRRHGLKVAREENERWLQAARDAAWAMRAGAQDGKGRGAASKKGVLGFLRDEDWPPEDTPEYWSALAGQMIAHGFDVGAVIEEFIEAMWHSAACAGRGGASPLS